MKRSRRKNKAGTSDSPNLRAPVEVALPLPAERQRANFPTVAIGASAGGLPLFQQFFDQMPANSGVAFVLVQHLDPNHETLMPELLAKHTSMPVELVAGAMPLEPNHIYVGSANTILSVQNGVLQVSRPASARVDRLPIDHFFISLAEDQGHNVIAIILSGNGVDGTVGLRAVKEQGGLTLAQSVETAKYDSMPRHAISTGLVDHVLPVGKMPARILDYVTHLRALQARKDAAGLQQQVADGLLKIFPMLRRKTGHDFSRYKQTTLVRRVQRRLQVRYLDSVEKYLEELRRNPKELDDLFKDLLIGVTQFFRDSETFDVLAKQIIPDLFRDKPTDGMVRAWIPGCATGEEAYSIAILLAEHTAQLPNPPTMQIFGTDLDDVALEVARKGVYSQQIAEHVSPERLKRYFRSCGADYEVVPEIRELCVFSSAQPD
jgi:two-component system CheB/CheR fusion protein